jgi:uncharacterized membrane protein
MANAILIVQWMATWYMVGLIWMVQVVHYPMFDRVGEEQFRQYEADHNRLISPIVGIPMLVELATATWFVFAAWPGASSRGWAIAGLIMIAAIWLTTAFVSVPCHARLAQGFDHQTHRLLVSSNWIRTILWTARGLMLSYLVYRLVSTSTLDQTPIGG